MRNDFFCNCNVLIMNCVCLSMGNNKKNVLPVWEKCVILQTQFKVNKVDKSFIKPLFKTA